MVDILNSSAKPIKGFIITVVCQCFLSNLFAQSLTPDKPVVNIPTSPEAAIIGRFGDIPIGYYTGTANISIPLYSIKEGDIEIPLTLQYHSSGIKVDDQATWVGLGWDLSPEGSIIQEVRGKNDEYDLGINCEEDLSYYFKQRFSPLEEGIEYPYMFLPQWGRATATNECAGDPYPSPYPPPPLPQTYYDSYCIIDKLLRGFGQPDIYNYNFGGYSGKFYINPSNNEVVLIDRDKQIFFEKTNPTSFKATTLDGTVWNFDIVEVVNGFSEYEYYGKTFKLSSVVAPTGRRIDFSYTDHSYVERALNQNADLTIFSGYPVHESYTVTDHHVKTLSRITTTDAYIDFNASSREDINVYSTDNIQKLSSIDVTARATNKKVKTVQFSYSYFPFDYTGVVVDTFVTAHANALGKRLRLDSVKEIGYTDNQIAVTNKPAYTFEYDMNTVMPLKISFAKDFWGYYNGSATNNTLLPNLDYFDYFNKPEYKPINNLPLSYPYTGADRFTNNAKAGAYLLKKIVYPTGGFSEFTYEPNSFSNQFIPDQSSAVHKSYDVQDNSLGGTSYVSFKLSKATTIHFDNHINNGAGNYNGVTPLTYDQMAGCNIKLSKVKMVNGSPVVTLIKQWDLASVLRAEFEANGGKIWTEDLRIEFDPDPNPTFNYLLQVVFPDELNNPLFASIAGVSSHITFYDDTGVDTTISNQCGMRIKSVKNYLFNGALASDKLIKYYDGKLLNRFRPLTVYKANNLNESGVTNGNGYEYITFYNKIRVSGTDFGINGGNLIGYGKVEELELSQGNEDHGKKVFTYLNVENKTGQDCPNTPNLRNGLIAKEEILNDLNEKLTEKTYAYKYLQPTVSNYVCVNIVRLSTGSKVPCGNLYDPTPYTIQYYQSDQYIGSEYGFNAYTIKSEWNKLESVTTTQYENSNALTTFEAYTYNSEGSVSTITTNNSKEENLITKYYYPQDYQIDYNVDNFMTLSHITGTPVITEKYLGTDLLTRTKTVFGSFSNLSTLLPQYMYSQTKTNPEERQVTINSYDDKGNITQYTKESNIPVSIVWNSDKTLPIAQIENATYASLLALPNGLNSDFRISLPNARVTTFIYKPLAGMTSQTDARGRTTYYEYDDFGRLKLIKDHDGNIIKTFNYQYQQPQQ